jgi:hypothetical protein
MSFGLLKFDKMATKFKMASDTYIFLILLSKLQFSTDFKKLECIRSVFLLSNFYRKSKMADFSKMTSFLRKNLLFTFFKRVVPTPILTQFFSNPKMQFCSTKTQDIPKKIAKENFPRWRIFSKWRLYFFLVWKNVLWPLF